MNKVVYGVPNISCNHCVHTIEMELGDLEGVLVAKADSENKQVEIEFEDPATESSILKILNDINYPAEI